VDQIAIINLTLLLGAALLLAGVLSSLVALRFGAPLLLVFLLIGMLAGEDGPGGILFSDYRLTYLIGSLALAVILFDGGLRTRLAAYRGAIAPAVLLATVGVVVTAGLTGLFAHVALGLGLIESLLIGAVVASTDAAAVFFLLRAGGLRLRRTVGATLEMESGTNDPIAVFLTMVLVEIMLARPGEADWTFTITFFEQSLIGAAVGLAGGFAIVFGLNRIPLPAGLHPVFVTAASIAVFALAAFVHGSGFLAANLAGLVVGNRPVRAFASILSFQDTVTWLFQLVMFMVLGLLVTPTNLVNHLLPALAIAAFLMLVSRPAAVFLCLAPFHFHPSEKIFISWVGLRGAVSIFLAAIPTLSGLPNGQMYFNVAFVVVLASLLVQGWSLTAAARRLGVALADTSPDVKRIEIDLPGQLQLEMVAYPIAADSPIMRADALPSWLRPVFVVRDGRLIDIANAGALAGGDYGYFLVPPTRVASLDRLFAPESERERAPGTGLFLFPGDASLASICATYNLAAPADLAPLGVAAAFAHRFSEGLDVGDRIDLGPATLIAIALQGDHLTIAGLEIDEPSTAADVVRRAFVRPMRLWDAAILRLKTWRR